MASVRSPLSPHLSVYKWQITMILSITHRATGVFLSLGLLFLSCWLLAIASGPEAFAAVNQHVTAWYGRVILIGVVFSIYFHLCNGIRHLVWDVGYGFEIKSFYSSGYAVLIATAILTVLTVLLGGVL